VSFFSFAYPLSLHSDCFLFVCFVCVARSSRFSSEDDEDANEKTMLLTDVCFGKQILLTQEEIPNESVKDIDTVSAYERHTFYPSSHYSFFFFLCRSKL
jgi:hypothetical protein